MGQSELQHLTVGEVFTAGGLPTITYNPRDDRHLEQRVTDYLDERCRILSVAGRTKTGKSVLLRNALESEQVYWLAGGAIRTPEDFWDTIADQMRLATEHGSTQTDHETHSRSWLARLTGGIAGGSRSSEETIGRSRLDSSLRRRSVSAAVRSELAPFDIIVIDDFHYVPSKTQQTILRALKDRISEGLALIVASTPHRVEDTARLEREMVGRLVTIDVPPWSEEELMDIASSGFTALSLVDRDFRIAAMLASESHSNPNLMQELCRELCRTNGVYKQPNIPLAILAGDDRADPITLSPPPDWHSFFAANIAPGAAQAFDRIARSRKVEIGLDSIDHLALASAVLSVTAKHGTDSLSVSEIYDNLAASNSLEGVDIEELRMLVQHMNRESGGMDGEPPLDYQEHSDRLHIVDPYFAYFLRWMYLQPDKSQV